MSLRNKLKIHRRAAIAVFGVVGVGIMLTIVLLSAPVQAQLVTPQRLIKSSIGTNEILNTAATYRTGNFLVIDVGNGEGLGFDQLRITDDVLQNVLGVSSLTCNNGTRHVVQMDNGMLGNGLGTTFAFYYLNSWYLRGAALDVANSAKVNATLAWIFTNAVAVA